MENVSDKGVEKTKHILYVPNFFFQKLCCFWDTLEKDCRAWHVTGYNKIRRMRFAYWVNKAAATLLECVIHFALPRWQGLCKQASMLYYTNIDCLC